MTTKNTYFLFEKAGINKLCRRISCIVLFFAGSLQAQFTLNPQLIGSAGGTGTAGGYSLSFSCGEVVITTATNGNFILTQGFQQPEQATMLGLNATIFVENITCAGADNGRASLVPVGGTPPYSYSWSNGDTTSSISGLESGIYTYLITDAMGLTYNDTITIIEGNGICDLTIYTGITPNGDGENEFWTIGSIELHLPNSVAIFNRWGVNVWSGQNYDNTTVRWEGLDKDGNQLPDGTYYYIIRSDNKLMKGWVELSR